MNGTKADFSRYYKYSKAAVTQFDQAGKLVYSDDGMIDFESSKARIDATSNPSGDGARLRHAQARGGVIDGLEETRTYQTARAVKEKFLAMTAKLEYESAAGNVVVRNDVHKAAFEAARKLRDTLHSVCKQVAPNIVNVDDPAKIEMCLLDEVNKALHEFVETCEL